MLRDLLSRRFPIVASAGSANQGPVLLTDTFVMGYRQDVMPWSSADAYTTTLFNRTTGGVLGGGWSPASATAGVSNGQYVEWNFLVGAGTYALLFISRNGVVQPIVNVTIDGTAIATVDLYAGATTNNVENTVTGIALAAGHHSIRFTVNGKNASSTNYLLQLQAVSLIRTGA